MPGCRVALLLLAPVFSFGQASSPATSDAAPTEAAREEVEAHFGTTVVIPSGLRGLVYFIPPGSVVLPKFEKLEPVGTIYTTGLNLAPREFSEGFPGVTKRFEWFAIDYTGRFYIDKPGKYHFAMASDDGSKLYIDGKCVINLDGIHAPEREDTIVKLEGGIHSIRVSYFQGPRYQIALMLSVAGPGDNDLRVFNTNEFKPPANPADWKYGNPDDLKTPPDPNAGRKKLRDVIKTK
jgi:hypothetical protein